MGTALVVEDDHTQKLIISKILKRTGLNVIFAGNEVEAIQLAQNHCPDVVVLDITTPYMSSYEVYRQLKSTEQARQPAVLMYSNKTDSYKWSQGSKLGADAYLSKLCRPQELVDTVKQLLLQQPAFQA